MCTSYAHTLALTVIMEDRGPLGSGNLLFVHFTTTPLASLNETMESMHHDVHKQLYV